MPFRKQSAVELNQHDNEVVSASTDAELDSDLDEGFDPVQAATDLKKVIEGHKKRRYAIRKTIEARYEARVADIVRRTEIRMAERDKKIASCRREQLAHLVAAVTERDALQRAAADKVARFYDGCVNLANLLDSVYTGLAVEAESAKLAKPAKPVKPDLGA